MPRPRTLAVIEPESSLLYLSVQERRGGVVPLLGLRIGARRLTEPWDYASTYPVIRWLTANAERVRKRDYGPCDVVIAPPWKLEAEVIPYGVTGKACLLIEWEGPKVRALFRLRYREIGPIGRDLIRLRDTVRVLTGVAHDRNKSPEFIKGSWRVP